jgi:hypothetical protein
LSDYTDNQVEDEEMTGDGWDDDEPIAPRPRGRLLRPLPLALIAVTIAAAGFLGGVLAQKGSEGSSGAGGLGGLPSFVAAEGGAAAASGTVTGVEGHTIYVKESDGTVVAVKAGDGATLIRDSNVAAKKIHPGDTVTVEGSKHGSTVKASSISATESGVESAGGLGASGGATSAGEGSGSEGTSVESLFGE